MDNFISRIYYNEQNSRALSSVVMDGASSSSVHPNIATNNSELQLSTSQSNNSTDINSSILSQAPTDLTGGEYSYMDPRILFVQQWQAQQMYVANLFAQHVAMQQFQMLYPCGPGQNSSIPTLDNGVSISNLSSTNNFDPQLLAEQVLNSEKKVTGDDKTNLDDGQGQSTIAPGDNVKQKIDISNQIPTPLIIKSNSGNLLSTTSDQAKIVTTPLDDSTPSGNNFTASNPKAVVSSESISNCCTSMESSQNHEMPRCSNSQEFIEQLAPYRHLNSDERQTLLRDAADITHKLMRIYSLCDIDVLVLNCSLQHKKMVDRKASCVELLVAADEMETGQCFLSGHSQQVNTTTASMSTPIQNPLKLACDIYHGQRTLFPKYEVLLEKRERYANHLTDEVQTNPHRGHNAKQSSPLSIGEDIKHSITGLCDPYQRIPYKYDMRRGETLREIASNYTSMYRKSHSNQILTVKEASIDDIEDLFRNYHKDGYRLSPSVKSYLESHVSNRKGPLGSIQPQDAESKSKNALPICWDVAKVPISVKYAIYKVADGRRSEKARERAKTLVHFSKRYISNRKTAGVSVNDPNQPIGDEGTMEDDDVEEEEELEVSTASVKQSALSKRAAEDEVPGDQLVKPEIAQSLPKRRKR